MVRYADTNGYERDGAKPSAWRYRDYVIDAFNRDKPYDRFVTEQLAGDEVPGANAETQIATTFLRLGTWDDEPADPAVDRYDQLDDVLGTTATAFLGADAALRPLPRPQVRAVHADGLLPDAGRLRAAQAAADRPARSSTSRSARRTRCVPYRQAQDRWKAEWHECEIAWTR